MERKLIFTLLDFLKAWDRKKESEWGFPQIQKEEDMWNQYKRKGMAEMRPYVKGEDLAGISVSDVDKPKTDMGMIARNPNNHADQWYVAHQYFEDNFELDSG